MAPKHKHSSSLSLDGFKDLITLNRLKVNALIAKDPRSIDKPVSEGFLGALVRMINSAPAGSLEWLKAARLLALIVRDCQESTGMLYQEDSALASFKDVLTASSKSYPPECRTVALRVVFRVPYSHSEETLEWLYDHGWLDVVANVIMSSEEDGVVQSFAVNALAAMVGTNAKAEVKLRENKDWLEGVTNVLFKLSPETMENMVKQFSLSDRTEPIKDAVVVLCLARPSPFVVTSLSHAIEGVTASTSLEVKANALRGLSEVVRTDRAKTQSGGATSIHDLAIDACVLPLLLSMASIPKATVKEEEADLLLGIKSHALGCLVVLTHQQRRIKPALEQAVAQSNAVPILTSIESDEELPIDLRQMATQVLARLAPNAPDAGSYLLALRKLP